MTTQVLLPTAKTLQTAGTLLRAGELVGFPTETVYGLGANALDQAAVLRIFEAKGRPADNPLIVHIASLEDVAPLIKGDLPEAARKLAEAYWPGPMTMVLPKSSRIPLAVSAGLSTVGIRFPDHPVAQALIQAAGVPIAAPSANRSGRPSPTTAAHVLEDMDERIPLILDGGPCRVGVESTVIDLTCDPVRVLRPGGVTPSMIARVLGSVEVDGSVLRPLMPGEVVRSPGMKYRHYAPKGEMTLVSGANVRARLASLYDEAERQGETALILAKDARGFDGRLVRALGETDAEAAASLFALLREADALGVQRIYAEVFDPEGVGLAVMNRMGRAAGFHRVVA